MSGVLYLLFWAAALPHIGDPAPRLDLTTAAGPRLEALPGDQVNAVEFFATYCEPCQQNLEDLRALRGTTPGGRFRVVVIAIEGDTPRVRAYFAGHPALADVVAFDPGAQAAHRWGEDRLPTTFFVDRGGAIRHINRGHGSGFRARAGKWLQAMLTTQSPPAPAQELQHQ
jgi:cytochrome c biogenesis protein CcmG/thiol:disulfide interchange protein DsbE